MKLKPTEFTKECREMIKTPDDEKGWTDLAGYVIWLEVKLEHACSTIEQMESEKPVCPEILTPITDVSQVLKENEAEYIKNKIKIPTCEVCRKNKSIIVCCVPSVPISCAYCEECYNMNAHPWWILVSNTACAGGLDKTADWWKWMVTDTCDHLGKSIDVFLEEVTNVELQEVPGGYAFNSVLFDDEEEQC